MIVKTPLQYLVVLVSLVLFAPACKQDSGLKLYFSDGDLRPANSHEMAKTIWVGSADGVAACSAALIDKDLVITADHCGVGEGSVVIGGVSFSDLNNPFQMPMQDGKVVETLAKGEFLGNSIATITGQNPDGSQKIEQIPIEARRDVSIHRIKWGYLWFEEENGQASKSERQFIYNRIWADPQQYGLSRSHISNRTITAADAALPSPVDAYTVGFPSNQKEIMPQTGQESSVVKAMYSDGRVLDIKAINDNAATKSIYTLNLTTGTHEGNSGGPIAEKGTDVLLGVVSGSVTLPQFNNDKSIRHDPNARHQHNKSVALFDAYHFDPELGPVLRRLFDENGYRRNTSTVINPTAPAGSQPSRKLSKIAFRPEAVGTKVLVTALSAVTEMTVCGGTSVKCLPMQNVAQIRRDGGLFVVEIDKPIPHSFKGTLPLIVRMKIGTGTEIEEVFDLERI